MSKRQRTALGLVAVASLAGCGGAPEARGAATAETASEETTHAAAPMNVDPLGPADTEVVPAHKLTRGADGSLQREFLGGAFVTWNSTMPIEIDQAISGEPTRRPVMVWAGD